MSEHKDSIFRNSWALKLTDRGLSEYEELAHFKHQNIPQRGIVLNIGSGLYQTFEEYLREAVRVLKPGGKLHIFNTYLGDPLIGNQEDEKKLIEMQQTIFKNLRLNAEVFIQTERIIKDDKGNDVEDKRIGVIITK